MKEPVFDRMLDEIYGAFGRQRPTYGTPAYKSIWRRLNENNSVPDAAARAIAYSISDYDSLPVNLGKAIMSEYRTWLSEHPELRAKLEGCPECAKGMAGFFWAKDAAGQLTICKCACNIDPRFDNMRGTTHAEARRNGMTPVDGTEIIQGTLAQAEQAAHSGQGHKQVHAALNADQSMRPAHKYQRELYDAEYQANGVF